MTVPVPLYGSVPDTAISSLQVVRCLSSPPRLALCLHLRSMSKGSDERSVTAVSPWAAKDRVVSSAKGSGMSSRQGGLSLP